MKAHANCGPFQVFYDAASVGLTYEEIAARGSALPEPLQLAGSRLVVHIQTSDAAVEDFLNLVQELANEKKSAGFVKHRPSRGDKVAAMYVRPTL